MGSPLGPLFADAFMNHSESELKDKLEANGMLYYRRFVGDNFVLVKETANPGKLLYILNSFHTDIQFTVEIENNGSLPFLDILITRTINSAGISSFATTIYRKHTFTGLLVKWNSFVPFIKSQPLAQWFTEQFEFAHHIN